MAKLAISVDHNHNPRPGRRKLHRDPQPRKDSGSLHSERGGTSDILRNSCGQSVVDGGDDHSTVRHLRRLSRLARDVDDKDLGSEVTQLQETWPEELLLKTAEISLPASPGPADILEAADNIRRYTDVAYALQPTPSTYGGVITLTSVLVDDSATVHVALWHPRYYRRPYLIRAILRSAAQMWSLRRFTAIIPVTNTAANRFAPTLGAIHEGTMRAVFCYNNGEEVDGEIWGLLRKEL